RSPKVWAIRAVKGIPIYIVVGALVTVLVRWKTYFPDETYEDIDAAIAKVVLVDPSDSARFIDNMVSIERIMVTLREGRSVFRILQFEATLECDSLVTCRTLNER